MSEQAAVAETRSVVHSTFSIERTYAASPARVFAAFADPAAKRRWFAEGERFELREHTLDFRVGGRETTVSRFEGTPPPGHDSTEMRNDTVYQDIVPDRRIVLAYTMAIGGRRFSASQATFELLAEGAGTRFVFTEQAAFFEGADGPELREQGWRALLESLARELARC
jgi:uncharacterized protein YndB with AHSA1/START domain